MAAIDYRKEAMKQRGGLALASLLLCDIFFTMLAAPLRGEPSLQFPTIPPTPPAEAEKTFEVLHGFRMQLIAAEPLVTSPVAITYDEDGRAFVCEMNDYPYTDKAHHKASQENPTDQPIGKVRMLVDTDGDGVFDKSTIFADGLSWPTGSVCWKGGIIVVATPDIWYFKDTDGDGVAEVRQKLFTGLKKLNVQAVANNPIWGLDNKISIAGGSNGGTLQNLVHPEQKPITFRRNDLILDPVKMTIELASGGARFGNTRDDWGNRFLCNIRNPLEHVVIEQRYLARNPYLPPVNPLADVAESGDQLPVYRISPPEQWRELRAKRWSADPAVTAHMPRSELVGAGVVTSSSGCTIYRGDAYSPEYRGMAFVNDVAGNLFYRLKLEPDGVTFKGTRIDGKKEFVASRDIWFRPVNFANAPDGTLTVCDMYREVIEHPWSLPDDIHAALDLERGRDKGRLYRLVPQDFKLRKTPQLSKASTPELVALLAHPNAWHRDTTHRLLFEKQDKSAVPLLREMVERNESPLAKTEAMWVLLGLESAEGKVVERLMSDHEPKVRVNALKASEFIVPKPDSLRSTFAERAKDADQVVRFQTALSLSGLDLIDVFRANPAQILAADLANPWTCNAILCLPNSAVESLVGSMVNVRDTNDIADTEKLAAFVETAAMMIGRASSDEMSSELLLMLADCDYRHSKPLATAAALNGLTRGLSLRGKNPSQLSQIYSPKNRDFAEKYLSKASSESTTKALSKTSPADDRTRAITLLALLEFPKLQPVAAKLLQASEPDAIRVATIKLLGQQRDAKVADLLFEAWPTLTPATREAALQTFAAKPGLADALLTAIEQGRIKAAEISPTARMMMTKTANAKLRDRASKLFAGNASRQEVVAKYQSALSLKGDVEAGHKVYQTICVACHRKGDEGRDIGPNLATVLAWTPEQLLTNILDPNREVAPNFLLYIVETNDNRILSGIITNETPASVSLKGADGVEQSVPRSEVKSLKSAGVSLMPEGVEAAVNPQQMADLMAFIRGS